MPTLNLVISQLLGLALIFVGPATLWHDPLLQSIGTGLTFYTEIPAILETWRSEFPPFWPRQDTTKDPDFVVTATEIVLDPESTSSVSPSTSSSDKSKQPASPSDKPPKVPSDRPPKVPSKEKPREEKTTSWQDVYKKYREALIKYKNNPTDKLHTTDSTKNDNAGNNATSSGFFEWTGLPTLKRYLTNQLTPYGDTPAGHLKPIFSQSGESWLWLFLGIGLCAIAVVFLHDLPYTLRITRDGAETILPRILPNFILYMPRRELENWGLLISAILYSKFLTRRSVIYYPLSYTYIHSPFYWTWRTSLAIVFAPLFATSVYYFYFLHWISPFRHWGHRFGNRWLCQFCGFCLLVSGLLLPQLARVFPKYYRSDYIMAIAILTWVLMTGQLPETYVPPPNWGGQDPPGSPKPDWWDWLPSFSFWGKNTQESGPAPAPTEQTSPTAEKSGWSSWLPSFSFWRKDPKGSAPAPAPTEQTSPKAEKSGWFSWLPSFSKRGKTGQDAPPPPKPFRGLWTSLIVSIYPVCLSYHKLCRRASSWHS